MAKFDRVSYSQSYETVTQYGLKRWQKIGVEMVMEENDDPKNVLSQAKLLVDEFHKETNKPQEQEPLPDIQKPQEKLSPLDQTIADIESCKELKVLESYRLIVKNNDYLKPYYAKQYEKLTNG